MSTGRRTWTSDELAELARMHAAGAGRAAICRRFGRSEAAVRNAVARLRNQGVELPNGSGLDSELDAYKRMVREGSAALLAAIDAYQARYAQAVAA